MQLARDARRVMLQQLEAAARWEIRPSHATTRHVLTTMRVYVRTRQRLTQASRLVIATHWDMNASLYARACGRARPGVEPQDL